MGPADTAVLYDYIVLGAGPAGLQLGYFFQQVGRSYVIVDVHDSPGGFFRRFPRHRQLLSINKVHTGYEDSETQLRFDWNSLLSDGEGPLMPDVSQRYFPSADELREYLGRYAAACQLNVQYGVEIVQVSKQDSFVLRGRDDRRFRCKRLLVASGVRLPYVPPIPGIELAEHYADMSVDPNEFVDQRVLIIGKGNSAFETAKNLIETAARIHIVSPSPVTMAWQTHFPGHLRAINNEFLDTYQLKSQNAAIDAAIDRIERVGNDFAVTLAYAHADGEVEQLRYDRVLVCTGFRFDEAIFDDTCRPELVIDGRFPRLTSAWESTSVADLFFAGVLMYSRDVKKASSSFIHGFRYNVRALHRILECRYHGGSWPSRTLAGGPSALADALLRRINSTSALWQQFGFLCDLFVFSNDGSAQHYEELPVGYVLDSGLTRGRRYMMLTLEYGPHQPNPFSVARHPTLEHAAESTFLHPVIRCFDSSEPGGELVDEHHLLENLLGEWRDEEQHRRPLLAFLRRDDRTARARRPAETGGYGR